MAEVVGFEPTSHLRLTVFKTVALIHSAILPKLASPTGLEPVTYSLEGCYSIH